MSETGLNYAETTHRSTWWIIGANRPAFNRSIVAFVGALGVGDGID